jgi:hypothetical protein
MSDDLSRLTLVELLELLEPVPEPTEISLWPQTEGWIWFVIVLVASAGWLVRRWLLRRRTNAYRRAALKEIAAADNDSAALAEILRRTALAAFPRADVAALHGERWLDFLDRAYGGSGFRNGPGRVLATAPYAPVNGATDLAPLATDWVRRHRRPGSTGP